MKYIKKIIQSVNLFIKSDIYGENADIEEKGRRKLFFIYLFIIFFPLILYGIFHLKNNLPEYGIPNLIAACVILFFIYLLRYLKKGKNLFRVMIFIEESMLVYWIFTGFAQGLGSLLVFSFPLLAFFLMGRKEGTVWSFSIALVCLLIFFNPFHQLNSYSYSFQFIARYMTSLFVIIFFTYYYESVREKYKEGMEIEQKKLIEERNFLSIAKEETDRANKLLMLEMEEKRKFQNELEKHRNTLEDMVAVRTEELRQKNNELQNAFNDLEIINRELQKSKSDLDVSESHYRMLADNITDLIWIMDMSLKFNYVSPSVMSMYGLTVDEALARSLDKWSIPASTEKIIKAFTEQLQLEKNENSDPERSVILELEQYKKDGTVFPVECKVSFLRDREMKAVGIIGITRDITEKVESQKEKEYIQSQLAHAQKMEAMGTLVGGLAHDFNNLLGGIIGSMDLIKINLEKESLAHRDDINTYLKVAMDSAQRSTNIIKQLMTISKKRKLELAPVDISQSLSHILTICKTSFPKSIKLDFDISQEKLFVLAEAIQIEQVLLNLCINASHAMTIMRDDVSHQGGTLTVRLKKIRNDEDLLKVFPEAREYQSLVCVDISDTGVGMDGDVLSRIFEPFFTTKKQEEGTGLGLSISYSIVKQHNGYIHVVSTPGKLTTFSIYLPEYTPTAEIKKYKDENQAFVRGAGTILVIDDEKIIIDVVNGILSRSGYNVISAMTPEAGIALYKEKFNGISAVILDLSMPQMSGIDAFKELKIINPGVRGILSSGMLDTETRNAAFSLGIIEVLNKPFNAAELTAVLDKILK